MKTVLLLIFWGVALIASTWAMIHYLLLFNDVELSSHGTFALILGVVFSLALGIGLMRLVYWSHKNGYDEQ